MKIVAIVKYVFLLTGLGLLGAAATLYIRTDAFLKTAHLAEGTVIEVVRSRSSDSYSYFPVVEFTTYEGQPYRFQSSSGSNPASYAVGEQVEVFYDPDQPQSARINGFFPLWGAPLILGLIGSVQALVSLGIFGFLHRKKRRVEHLKRHGIPIQTQFESVGLNGAVRVNGRSPYCIYSQWLNPETSQLHIFQSDNIWFNPSDHILSEEITVLIEPGNPKHYHVDTSFLPETAR